MSPYSGEQGDLRPNAWNCASFRRAWIIPSLHFRKISLHFPELLDPGLEPVAFPALWPDQHDPGRLHEQDAQVAIAAPRYLAEDRAVSSRYLLGHQSKPGAEVAAFGEHISSANCGNHRARDDRPHAGHRHQPIACRILMGERRDLGRKALNALVQPAPVASQVLDYPCHAWRQGLGARGKEVRQLGTQET